MGGIQIPNFLPFGSMVGVAYKGQLEQIKWHSEREIKVWDEYWNINFNPFLFCSFFFFFLKSKNISRYFVRKTYQMHDTTISLFL